MAQRENWLECWAYATALLKRSKSKAPRNMFGCDGGCREFTRGCREVIARSQRMDSSSYISLSPLCYESPISRNAFPDILSKICCFPSPIIPQPQHDFENGMNALYVVVNSIALFDMLGVLLGLPLPGHGTADGYWIEKQNAM